MTDTCFANNFPQITGTISAGGVTNIAAPPAGTLSVRDAKFCTNKAQSLWNGVGSQVKLQLVYPLPYSFMIAATYKHLPGIPETGSVTYTNAAIAPILGRNLSACSLPADNWHGGSQPERVGAFEHSDRDECGDSRKVRSTWHDAGVLRDVDERRDRAGGVLSRRSHRALTLCQQNYLTAVSLSTTLQSFLC